MRLISKKIGFIILFLMFVNDLSSQCAMCKAQAEAHAEEDGSGINTGIIYIMTIPYIILGVVFHKQIIAFLRNWKSMK